MSAFKQVSTLTIAVGQVVSEQFGVGDFQRGSWRTTTTGNEGAVNFDVSNDGTTWETLTLATTAFADVTMPGQNLVRALPATLFQFRYARFRTTVAQAAADALFVAELFAN